MKNSITTLGTILYASLTLMSCAPNDNRQKELELRERELALKEKEFALKETALSQTDSTGQKSTALASPQKPVSQNKAPNKLVLTPQKKEGTLGQITFSQMGKTLFYFERKPQKGKVVINGTEYGLSKLSYDPNHCSYEISGEQVTINASNCKYDEAAGGDCGYGKFSTVIIAMKGVSTAIENVKFQDCPNIDF